MMRIGHGYDVHAFGEGDHVMLGGVRITSDRGLVAHSDGDVACQNAALEVYSHEPVRLAVQCDEGVDVIVSYTLSPWSTLMTTPVLFDDGALLELPYRGDGPYHAARLTVSRTDGHLGTASCEVFLASQDAMLE